MNRPASSSDNKAIQITGAASKDSAECWRCTDSPCHSLTKMALRLPSIQEIGSVVPKSSVCPVDALTISANGDIQIDANSCIGCGLCLTNCPVGAIYLDSDSGVAKVKLQPEGSGAHENNILALRDEWARSIEFATPTGAQINNQLELVRLRLLGVGSSKNHQDVRLLVRNALISLGATTALRAQGANSLLSEVVAQEGGRTYLVEIEASDDTLDAFRRLITSSARAINSLEVERQDLSLVMFVPQLPNKRVDLYRLIKDARIYLGLKIIVIPFAALLAAVILRRTGLEDTFGNFVAEEGSESLSEIAERTFGFRFSEHLGLKPSK
jgi:ferredoxin